MRRKLFNSNLRIWLTILAVSLGSLGTALAMELIKPDLPSGAAMNAPFKMKNAAYRPSPREQYFQTWNAYWKTDNGYHIFANFVLSNLGVGDNTCGLNIAIVTPEGKSDVETLQLKGEHFTGSTEKLDVKCGQAIWTGDTQSITIQAQLQRLGLDMVMKRTAPGFDPPRVYLDPDHEDEVAYNMPHINSIATGKIMMDGKWIPLKGRAIVEHLAQNVPLYAYSRIWHRIRIMDGNTSLVMGGFEPSSDLKEGYTLLVITQGDRIVYTSDKAILKATAFETDPESGYKVPTAFTVSLNDPNMQLMATIERKRAINRIDVLEQLNWFLRVIVRTFFTNPWLFRKEIEVKGSYVLHGQKHSIDTKAMQEAIFVND